MDYIWNALKSLEYNARYISLYMKRVRTFKIVSEIFATIITPCFLSSLFAWNKAPWLGVLFSVGCALELLIYQNSVAYRISPYLPFIKREMERLCLEARNKYVEHREDDLKTQLKVSQSLRNRCDDIKRSILEEGLWIPVIDKLEKMAEEEVNAALELEPYIVKH